MFSKRDVKNALRLLGKDRAPGAHGHIMCLNLVSYHYEAGLRAARKKVKNVKGEMKGR